MLYFSGYILNIAIKDYCVTKYYTCIVNFFEEKNINKFTGKNFKKKEKGSKPSNVSIWHRSFRKNFTINTYLLRKIANYQITPF